MTKTFSDFVMKFLTVYLPRTRGYSPNTVSAYRDSFVLYLRYMESECGISPNTVEISDFPYENVIGFTEWLAEARGCSASTCNSRLAAIKSFFRYVQSQAPELINAAKPVLAIKAKKASQPEIDYLSVQAVSLLLKEALDSGGLRDAALLTLLYDSGARVQEIADLTLSDICLKKPSTIKLTGKGSKTRIVPVTPQAADILRKYASSLGIVDGHTHLFNNWKKEPIGRAGIAYILKKYVAAVHDTHPEIMPPKATPHTLRHSKSMHLLENGVNLIYIRDLLGHQSVVTTERYAKSNPEMKRKAIEKSSERIIDGSHYAPETKADLLNWLRKMM